MEIDPPRKRATQPRRVGGNGASVAPIPSRRFDTRQFVEVKFADRLQLLGERGLLECVGQVVEPRLILLLEVEQGAHRSPPALRARAPVRRLAVLRLRWLSLAPRSVAALSFRIRGT